ncbi:hypothetical protein CAEBREN_20872 [Caenorhabditis brenneri]|uniref:Phosphatidylinositol-specific phospholipase C X domain-containing protein n=1 Tax=Caenorhabditis brenneri TaxID=135651 RepID=G0MHI9_CAEBE|nr:hypothetical protein CAEBREN_20872 [Caenorhabditis brenneri]
MADWMARLPDSVKKKPICLLCIPGSHDTGANWFNLRLGFAHDQSFLRYIRHLKFSFVKRIVKRWGLTQSMSLDEQLMVGIRFLDLRLELALDTRYSSSIFIVHGLFATDGLKLISQIVKFLEAHKEEVLILNVSHIYRMSNEDFKRYFLDSLEIQAAHSGIKLCSTHENVLTMSLELLVSKNSRIIVIGPTDNDIVPVCFRSSVLQNKWPNKNSTAEIIRFVQAEIHAPVAPCLRVMQGVVTPKLSDIIRNLRSSLRLTYSLTMRSLLKIWVRQLNEEEIGNLNILISDQVDNEFCRLVYFLNVNDSPDHQLDQYFSNPHLDEPESPFPYAAVEKILYPDRPPTSVVQRTVPPRTENIKEIRETNVEEEPVAQIVEVVPVVEQALRTLGEDEPEIHIEEISGDFDVESSSSQPRIPHLRSVMVQQIEMVLETDTSSEGTSTLPRSPVPPPKPKRASQRIPLIMEVIPLPDDPPTYTPSVSICRSSGTPVRIAPPVTEEELRLAALGEYPPYGSFRSQRLREESVRQEAVIIEREELEEEESADESTPLVSHEVDSMVEDLVINSTIDAMDNLADRFKKSL